MLAQVGSHGATQLGWFDTNATVKITSENALKFVGTCLRKHTMPKIRISFKEDVQYPVDEEDELGSDSFSRRKHIQKLKHSSDVSRSLNGRIELKFSGVIDMGIPQPRNGWIFQNMSELTDGLLAPNLSRFPSRLDRAPVYLRLSEIPPLESGKILRGCFRLNFPQFHQSNRQSDARGGRDSERESAVQKKLLSICR
jgi:hypothetical protein